MTRIRFENAPSTNTPINAGNLNKLNNVVISSTEPTTGEEVWLQKGKNLCTVNSISQVNGERHKHIVQVFVAGGQEITISGIKTRISSTISNYALHTIAQISCYTSNHNLLQNIDPNDVRNNFAEGSINFNYNFTTPENCNYIKIDFGNNNGDTNFNTSVSDIQVEQGSTATSYEPYIDKKIYTQNNNGVYEEFYDENDKVNYSTEEQVIGTWIDFKPLYRKVIVLPNGTGTTDEKSYNLSDFGIANVEDIYISNPSFYTNGFNRYPFAYYDGNKFTALVSPNYLAIQTQYIDIANGRVVITLEYTKTTD